MSALGPCAWHAQGVVLVHTRSRLHCRGRARHPWYAVANIHDAPKHFPPVIRIRRVVGSCSDEDLECSAEGKSQQSERKYIAPDDVYDHSERDPELPKPVREKIRRKVDEPVPDLLEP